MTKKAGFVLFIIAATVFSILVTAVFFAILILLYSFLAVPHIQDEASFIGIPLLFLASIILSFLIYRQALKLYLKKHPF